MGAVFLTSDQHFSHKGVCEFTQSDGVTPLRPWNHPDEMDEELVKRFNERVTVNDKCYMLGDVSINRKGLKLLDRLNCKNIVLIKGNHCIFKLSDYTQYFRDIRAYQVLNGLIMSHIPIHPSCMGRFGSNIHGHLHSNRVMKRNPEYDIWLKSGGKNNPPPQEIIDPIYFSVCVEQHDFYPVLFEDALKMIVDQGGSIGFKNKI